MSVSDTICALATPPGQSALAIVRASGSQALTVLEQVFTPRVSPQRHFVATRGDLLNLDDAICISFPEGKSFTGEPSFELTLHGSPVVVEQVLEALRSRGIRTARPGEFSLRAFLSGKIDLSEAESIADLIHSRSEQAARVALQNLKGALAKYLEPTRLTIVDILCEIEARLDFPDEDLGQSQRAAFIRQLQESSNTLRRLLESARIGKKLTEGSRVVLMGLPNAGKSTLLNALLGEEKALVHHTPGTTRDVIEALWVLNGIPITLVDIAGIREAEGLDPVELLGIERARQELERADLILCLQEPGTKAPELPELPGVPVIFVNTKVDLLSPRPTSRGPVPMPNSGSRVKPGMTLSTVSQARDDNADVLLDISCKTGHGLDNLRSQISRALIGEGAQNHEAILTRSRQREEVSQALENILEASLALESGEADEVIAFELRCAGQALDRLLGKNLNEDVLDLIFSRFCIGK